ncbi:MAG: N-(5'-phosphoribosyl)anthranilate isomerase [Paracoccaceae bacterium]
MNGLIRMAGPDGWIEQLFAAKAARTGGVVRRSAHWVEREIGRERLKQEVHKRGFHMIECGRQIIVICNSGGLRVIC